MKAVILASILLLSALFVACGKDDDCCTNVDTGIAISVKDEDGSDLLNPNNPNAFQEKDIEISHLVDGEKKEYFKPNRDTPKGFSIYQDSTIGSYIIQIVTDDDSSEDFPVTYVRWSADDTDTIRCEYQRTENSLVCTKVWFNNVVKWEAYETGRYFEIVK